MEPATLQYKDTLKTKNLERIKQVIKLGIVREVSGIQARSEARKFAI